MCPGILKGSMFTHAAKEKFQGLAVLIQTLRAYVFCLIKKMLSFVVLPLSLQENSQDLKKAGETET